MSQTENMNVPDKAVEAAGYAELNGEVVCNFISEDLLRAALEAAAPYMHGYVADNHSGSYFGPTK